MYSTLDTNDYIEVKIDGIAYGHYVKSSTSDGYSFCSSYDLLNLYNKNLTTHTASSVKVGL